MASQLEKSKALCAKYKMVFGTEEGKEVLKDIITDCHVLGPVTTINTNEILMISGMRNAGLEVARKASYDINNLIDIVGDDK